MNLEKYKDKEILILTPNSEKLNILDSLSLENSLYNIKFMTEKEFLDNYFFSYDVPAIDYIMNKYKYHYDVCKVYLNNLYFIDLDKTYTHSKLNELKRIKQDLLSNKLLIENKLFKDYLKNKTIIVKNYCGQEKYLKNILTNYNTHFINLEKKDINFSVKHFNTLEEEVVYTALSIIKLTEEKIPLNKIFIQFDDDYNYLVKRIFTYFNIPINIKNKRSIYSTKIVSDYLKTKKLEIKNDSSVTKKLIDVINSLVEVEDSKNYNTLLKEKLKNTYLDETVYNDAVNVIDIEKRSIKDDEYVFVLGFNEDHLPKLYKDEDFITDNIKDEVELYTTKEKNEIKKNNFINILSNIKNLSISYKDRSDFSLYNKSTLINDYNLEVEDINIDNYNYSNIYNKLKLSEYLDYYRKYNKESKSLHTLYNHYKNIPYNTYSNEFTGITKEKLLEYIKKPMTLSYTSINSYNLCAFKFYIKYILKIDPFEDSFQTLIGSLYHYLLSIMKEEYFNFNNAWQDFLKDKELSLKEEFFLENLKDDFKELMEKLLEQEHYTSFKEEYYEKELGIAFDKEIPINFKGSIDKLMVDKNIDDTYFSVIDYKTGNPDTSLNNIYYGINMQLPIYLYLVSKSSVFESPIFTGMYYQKILQPKTTFTPKTNEEKEKRDKLKLIGYSTDNEEILEKFDNTYEDSMYIKSLKKTNNGFYRFSKLLSDEDVYKMLKFTDMKLNEAIDNIIDGKFKINPKIIDKKNISCAFCTYKDLCFKKESDEEILEKKKDLSFLDEEV